MNTEVPKQRSGKNLQYFYDMPLLLTTLALLAIGIIMVTSASIVISEQLFKYPFHFSLRQAIYLIVAIIAGGVISRINSEFWYSIRNIVLALAIVLPILVLVPGIGHEVNGSLRWIRLGPFSFQVSEAVKLCFIIFLASFLSRHQKEFNNTKGQIWAFMRPFLLLGIIGILLLKEPNFGALAVLFVTVLGMMFVAGSHWLYFIGISSALTSGMALIAIMAPYRMARLTAFLHPWVEQFGSGYQLTQSLIAFGRGGIFGQGLGNSVQKLYYLPEAHTDFVFAITAEELGLIGTICILGLYFFLTLRILKVGQLALDKELLFQGYFSTGVGIWIGLQALVNVGVTCGLLPTKGLTLPLLSYGGTSLLINIIAIAIVVRISHEISEAKRKDGRTKVGVFK